MGSAIRKPSPRGEAVTASTRPARHQRHTPSPCSTRRTPPGPLLGARGAAFDARTHGSLPQVTCAFTCLTSPGPLLGSKGGAVAAYFSHARHSLPPTTCSPALTQPTHLVWPPARPQGSSFRNLPFCLLHSRCPFACCQCGGLAVSRRRCSQPLLVYHQLLATQVWEPVWEPVWEQKCGHWCVKMCVPHQVLPL